MLCVFYCKRDAVDNDLSFDLWDGFADYLLTGVSWIIPSFMLGFVILNNFYALLSLVLIWGL